MKYLIILLLLIALGAGGYFFYTYFISYSAPTAQTTTINPDQANCSDGINGNTGDNYCSNYRGPGSKCTPRLPNTYPDGCSK